MGRIIKGTKEASTATESRPIPLEPAKYAEGGRVIEKDVYKAQLLARDILKEGEQARRRKLADARRITLQAKEEALASGAVEAFNETAKKAIEIFAQRRLYLANVAEDIRTLAVEICQKVLGGALRVEEKLQKEIVTSGIHRMRTKRKLTLQGRIGMLKSMETSVPGLLGLIEKEPDIDLEEIEDIKPGYFRIVTDAGTALCQESVAISTLQQSLHD